MDTLKGIWYIVRWAAWELPRDGWALRSVLWRLLRSRLRGQRFDLGTWQETAR